MVVLLSAVKGLTLESSIDSTPQSISIRLAVQELSGLHRPVEQTEQSADVVELNSGAKSHGPRSNAKRPGKFVFRRLLKTALQAFVERLLECIFVHDLI